MERYPESQSLFGSGYAGLNGRHRPHAVACESVVREFLSSTL